MARTSVSRIIVAFPKARFRVTGILKSWKFQPHASGWYYGAHQTVFRMLLILFSTGTQNCTAVPVCFGDIKTAITERLRVSQCWNLLVLVNPEDSLTPVLYSGCQDTPEFFWCSPSLRLFDCYGHIASFMYLLVVLISWPGTHVDSCQCIYDNVVP